MKFKLWKPKIGNNNGNMYWCGEWDERTEYLPMYEAMPVVSYKGTWWIAPNGTYPEPGTPPPQDPRKSWIISCEGGSSSAVWGKISGKLADQTDLQSALDSKQDKGVYLSDITSKDGSVTIDKTDPAKPDLKVIGGGNSNIEVNEFQAQLEVNKVWENGAMKWAGFNVTVSIREEELSGSETYRQCLIGNRKSSASDYAVMFVMADVAGTPVPYIQIERLKDYDNDPTKKVFITIYRHLTK